MKPEPTSALFAGPFALATLSAPGRPGFPALVTPDARVLDLRAALGDTRLTVLRLLEAWDALLPRLEALAAPADRSVNCWPASGSTLPSRHARSSSRVRTTAST